MHLTPLDVRKAGFRKVLRGFDPEEVTSFLGVVAEAYEKALQENAKLTERVQGLEERIQQYQNMERFLQDAMLRAERMAAEKQEASRLEAEKILAEARNRAELILKDARERLRQLNREVAELTTRRDLFIEKFRSLLQAESLYLEQHRQDLEEIEEIGQRVAEVLTRDAGNRAEGVEVVDGRPDEGEPSPAALAPEREGEDEPEEPGDEAVEEETAEETAFFPPRVRRQGFFDLEADSQD
jgi:cell division initiation protein